MLAAVGEAIVPAAGPEAFDQAYEATVPSKSVPDPVNETVDVGSWIVLSVPAVAIGG